MSKNRGKKVDLKEFLGSGFSDPTGADLPRAPRVQTGTEPSDGKFRRGYGDREQGFEDTRRGPRDPDEGRGDADSSWRRSASNMDGSSRGRERGKESETDVGFARSEEDANWRKGGSGAVKSPDDSSFARSETDSNWRRGTGTVPEGRSQRSFAEEDFTWRKSTRTPPSDSFTGVEEERPKLNLKKRTEPKTEENSQAEHHEQTLKTEETTQPAEANGSRQQEQDAKDKWDKIFKNRQNAGPTRRMFGDDVRDRERENAFQRKTDRPERRDDAYSSFSSRRRDDFDRRRDDLGRRDDFNRDRPTSNFFSSRSDRPTKETREHPADESRPAERPTSVVPPRISKESLVKSRVADWADETEDSERPRLFAAKEEKAVKKEKETEKPALSKEDIEHRVHSILKDYLVLQQKADAIKEIKEKLDGYSFQMSLVEGALNMTTGQNKLELKLLANLVESLLNENIISRADFEGGLDVVCQKLEKSLQIDDNSVKSKASESKESLRKLHELLLPKKVLEGYDFTACTKRILGLSDYAEGNSQQESEDLLVANLISLETKGVALVKEIKQVPNERKIAVGNKLLERLYSTYKGSCSEEGALTWIDKSQYGKVLAELLYREEPNDLELKQLVQSLTIIQLAFHAAGFPRTAKNVSIIERVFVFLYKNEILPLESFISWKEDISESPGKVEAIVQTSKFLNFLE